MTLSQDIPKLYTAAAEWLSVLVMILAHGQMVRARRWRDVLCLAGSLILLGVIQTLCGMVSNWFWLLGMAAAAFVMLATLKQTLGLSWNAALYTMARTFMWAELTAAIEWQLDRFYAPGSMRTSVLYSLIFCIVVYALMMAAFWAAEHYYAREESDPVSTRVTRQELLLVWAVTLIFFTLSNLSYVEISSPFRGSELRDIFNIRAMVDVAGVIMLELLYIQKTEADRRRESDSIRSVLHAQYLQFRESQDNIDLINQKYHDLKHQLHVLRAEEDGEKRLQYLDEIEQGIRFYEAEHKTGNHVLDTILTSKCHQCMKLGIRIHVVADGSLLAHMHVMDIATIFGNALDNAIEHEAQIQDRERRMIRVSVSAQGQMICILIENIFEGALIADEAGIQTTKPDRRYHGYGIKSIRYAVEKYGGFTTVCVEDGWFRLKIALPLKEVNAEIYEDR